jgi:hypothetical protein
MSDESDILTIRYKKDDMGEVVGLMDDTDYGQLMRISFNPGMFIDDPDDGTFQIFSMLVNRDDAKLKAALEANKDIFAYSFEEWEEPVLSPEAEAAARERLKAKGIDLGLG